MARMVEIFVLGSTQPFRCELADEKVTELCDKLSHGAGTVMYDWDGRTYLLRVAHITAVTFAERPPPT